MQRAGLPISGKSALVGTDKEAMQECRAMLVDVCGLEVEQQRTGRDLGHDNTAGTMRIVSNMIRRKGIL